MLNLNTIKTLKRITEKGYLSFLIIICYVYVTCLFLINRIGFFDMENDKWTNNFEFNQISVVFLFRNFAAVIILFALIQIKKNLYLKNAHLFFLLTDLLFLVLKLYFDLVDLQFFFSLFSLITQIVIVQIIIGVFNETRVKSKMIHRLMSKRNYYKNENKKADIVKENCPL